MITGVVTSEGVLMGYFIKGVLNRLSVNEIKYEKKKDLKKVSGNEIILESTNFRFYMINNMIPSVVRQTPSLPKTYFVRDIISYGYFGDVTRQRGTPFDEESEQGISNIFLGL